MKSAILYATLAASMPLSALAEGGSAIAPRFLFDPAHPDTVALAASEGDVTATPEAGGLTVRVKGGDASYPGFSIRPASGGSWDLSAWGHVEAKITNTSDKRMGVNLRVDNDGPWQKSPWNCESVWLKPGESKVLKVIFGHQYGFKPGYKLDPAAVVRLLLFLNKSGEERTLRVEDLMASGPAGEKPPLDPATMVTKPKNGIILGKGVEYKPMLASKGNAEGTLQHDGSLTVAFPSGKGASVTVKPHTGSWSLIDFHQVQAIVRNTGTVPVTPGMCVEAKGSSTDRANAEAPLAPGAETTLVASFVPRNPWEGVTDTTQAYNGGKPNTGSRFENTRVNGISLFVKQSDADAQLLIESIAAAAPPVEMPDWLGKRPPVEGDWELTFEDNFEGRAIDLQRWNIYTHNYWDKRTHFSRDNTILRNGKLILHYEEKTGYQNDDPNDTKTVGKTDFACGFASTYGKWTQRYGYYEARMKLPTCPGLWPAFWMMPDRGREAGPDWKRGNTGNGGMEFDIMEHLTAWGPYRFNSALHWDGYGKQHKAVGTSNMYVPDDADGFFTIGMLWTPGNIVFYGNGGEIGRWEHERVGSTQAYLIFYMVSGGWANVPLDKSRLPDDFVVDYVRVWQRKDLASPEDGPKANDGRPRMME